MRPSTRGKTKPREKRRFDKTQLRAAQHGRQVHRDYAAHFFRWVTVRQRATNEDTVLDVGCGQDVPLMFALGGNLSSVPRLYVGVDLNTGLRGRGNRWGILHEGFNFVDRWAELKIPNGYSVAVCFEVYEHAHKKDALQLLKNVRELLADDGIFYLSTPVFNGKAARNHLHEATIVELQKELIKARWKVDAYFGTFGNVKTLEKVLTREERKCWDSWKSRLGNDGLSVVFATNHPNESRNILWQLSKQT